MQKNKTIVKPGHLKPFFPFAEMPPEYVIIAAKFAEQISVNDGDVVLDNNSEDPNDYFLIEGSLLSEDIYGTPAVLTRDNDAVDQPLPQLRPSAYKIIGKGQATLVRIPQEVIRRVRLEAPELDPLVEDDVTLDITQSREFFNDFKEELQMNRVRLPSLAHSASRVHKLVAGDKVTKDELVTAVAMDPAITAKLLKMSNSSLFNREEKIEDLPGVIDRLGVYSSREIAACFAFRDVYKNTSPELVKRLEEQVAESRQVSAIAAAIAETTDSVDPHVAALAGLLHNVGVLPIFSYSMQNVAYAMNPDLVDRAIKKMSHKVGVMLAKKWRYGDEIIQSIEHSQDWAYSNGDRPDVVNIVLTAKYHYMLSRTGLKSIPKPKDVPSIAAATLGRFDEQFSLKILGRARELMGGRQIAAACPA